MAKQYPDEKLGSYRIRIRPARNGTGFDGLAFDSTTKSEIVHAETEEDLRTELLDWIGGINPNFFGWDGAIERFLTTYPEGFASETFISKERNPKVAASEKLQEVLPIECVADTTDIAAAVKSVLSATPLLAPTEKSRIVALLETPAGHDYVSGAAMFAEGDFENGLQKIDAATKPVSASTWTSATYLPYLWKPEKLIFLKPEVTKDFSRRVGHPFHHIYAPTFHPRIYLSMLDMVAEAKQHLKKLKPRDNIDIQCFMWIVGKYKDPA